MRISSTGRGDASPHHQQAAHVGAVHDAQGGDQHHRPGHHAGDKLAEEGDGDAPGGVVHQPELPCPAQHAEEHPPVAGQEAEPEGPPLPPAVHPQPGPGQHHEPGKQGEQQRPHHRDGRRSRHSSPQDQGNQPHPGEIVGPLHCPRSFPWSGLHDVEAAALFRRLVTASPIPPLSGHWAQMAETAVWSKARRASNTPPGPAPPCPPPAPGS